jgi:hypothetical protein
VELRILHEDLCKEQAKRNNVIEKRCLRITKNKERI